MLHGQKLSFDLVSANPSPVARHLVEPKIGPAHPSPSRPVSVAGARPPIQESVKGTAGSPPSKRVGSAGPPKRFVHDVT